MLTNVHMWAVVLIMLVSALFLRRFIPIAIMALLLGCYLGASAYGPTVIATVESLPGMIRT